MEYREPQRLIISVAISWAVCHAVGDVGSCNKYLPTLALCSRDHPRERLVACFPCECGRAVALISSYSAQQPTFLRDRAQFPSSAAAMAAMDKVLSSYYTLGSHASRIASSTSVRDAHDYLHWFLLDAPVVPALLAFHALFAAERVHALTQGKQFWFKSYVLTVFAAFGGSTLAAIFSGAPVPLFTTASNYMLGYITVAWYLVDQSRAFRSLLRTRPVNAILAFGASAAKARAIFSFMDNFIVKYPGAAAGAIALGGLAGSGGALFVSLEKKARRGFHTPSELSSPGWGFKSAYLVSMTYYVATDPEGILAELPVPVKYSAARDAARYALSLSLCTHAALDMLLDRSMNPTYILDRLFYAVTRVREEASSEFSALATETESRLQSASKSVESAKNKGVSSVTTNGVSSVRKRGKR